MSRSLRKPLTWLSVTALVALVPKCFLCVAAYLGLAAALGINVATPEICGVAAAKGDVLTPLVLGATAAVTLLFVRRFRRTHDHSSRPSNGLRIRSN